MSKFVQARFFIFVLVFVSGDFEVGTKVRCEELTVSPRARLIICYVISSSPGKWSLSQSIFLCTLCLKKQYTRRLIITLTNVDRFSKFFTDRFPRKFSMLFLFWDTVYVCVYVSCMSDWVPMCDCLVCIYTSGAIMSFAPSSDRTGKSTVDISIRWCAWLLHQLSP